MSKRTRRRQARDAAAPIRPNANTGGQSIAPTAMPVGGQGMGGMFAYDAANIFSQDTAEWNPWLR